MSDAIALVLLPPPHISALIDPLRSANDKSYTRGWASHITILFPFTPVEDIPSLVDILRCALSHSDFQPFDVKLDKVSRFATRDYETIYLGLSKSDPIQALWNISVAAMKHPAADGRTYTPHLTLGQTARNAEAIAFLTDKGNKILRQHDLSWHVDSVALLRRRDDLGGVMEMYAQIPIGRGTVVISRAYGISGTPTFHYDGNSWLPAVPIPSTQTSITLATYNVLHDSAFPLHFRFSGVRDAIIDSNVDVICLQEVTDEFLASILGDSHIRDRFRWCSRPDNAVMESERNVIILAREPYGFEWTRLELGGKHKAAIVARLHIFQSTIVIAGIHLTAGRASPIMGKKREELSILLAYLRLHHEANEWVIMGDTNWPEYEQFPHGEELIDLSSVAGLETYDPTANTLAAATARESREPQRYDRIFVKRSGKLAVIPGSIELFGLPLQDNGPASDHWGLKAVVHFGTPVEPLTVPVVDNISVAPLATLHTTITDAELHDICAQFGCVPSDEQNDIFKRAVDSLRIFLSNMPSHAPPVHGDEPPTTNSAVRIVASPVGSYAMGCHTPTSDLDCLVVGNINPGTFWNLMRCKIRAVVCDESFIRLRRFVKDASVQMMELEVHGVKMDIQYCPAGKLIDCWAELPSISPDSPLFNLPAPALRILNAHRDLLALQKALPSLDNFRVVHRALKLFLNLHGLIGARFGFLGGFHLSILLSRVCLLLPPLATPSQILRVFFHTYARWDWERDMVTVPIQGAGMGTYRRSMTREPMCILTIEKPMFNATASANPHSLEVMKGEFKFVDVSMENGSSWREICVGQDGSLPFQRFVKSHKAFVKVEVNYWGGSCTKGRALVGWLESRFVNLLVQLHTNVPSLRVRLWPARFTDGNAVNDHGLLSFYLFGLAPNPTSDEDKQLPRKENSQATAALLTTLRAFESTIQQNSRYYDSVDTFISVSAISSSQLSSAVVLDTHNWSDNGFDDDDDSVDTDDKDVHPDDSVFDEPIANCALSMLKKKSKDRTTPLLLAAKLRTSSDVFNRLMWDPSVSSVDYMIGYEDRFKGVKEMPLCSWKREVEDEAFIPFHRVVHFRRKSDNVFVWDRKTKTDLVFGSGVKASGS